MSTKPLDDEPLDTFDPDPEPKPTPEVPLSDITLFDLFALAATIGLVEHGAYGGRRECLAKDAWDFAEAAMEEREARQ